MASEMMAETNIKMSESSGAQIGDLVNHRMIVTNGETLGNPSVGPTVLEMSCSAENNTEDSIDKQKYESRQKEHRENEEDGAVVKHRNYEELAERTRVQNLEDAEVSSNSTIKFEEQEKIREKDGESKVAEYNATCSEKHETTVSTTEKIGDREFTRRRSTSKSLTRTCKRIEDMEDFATTALANGSHVDGGSNTETTESNETSESSGFEKGDGEDVLVKRSEKTTKSERSSTTISGKGDPAVFEKYEGLLTQNKTKGALIDLGALGEIKLSPKVVSSGENTEENTLERDFQKSDYFNPDLAGLDFSSTNLEDKKVTNGVKAEASEEATAKTQSTATDFVRQVKEHAQERTAAATSSNSIKSLSNSGAAIASSTVKEEGGASEEGGKVSSSSISTNSNTNINSSSSTSNSTSSSSSTRVQEASEISKTSKSCTESTDSSNVRRECVSMAEQNGHCEGELHVGGGALEEDDEPRSLPPSFNRRRPLYDDEEDDYESAKSLPPPFAPKNRAATDDLIKRILAEAKGGTSSSSDSTSTAKMNGTASDSPKTPSSPLASPLTSPLSRSVTSPLSPTGKMKVKIDMGGEKDLAETSSTISSSSEMSNSRMEERSSAKDEALGLKSESLSMRNESMSSMKSESQGMKSESLSMQSESMHSSSSSKAVGAERKRLSAEEDEMSLFERRLAKGVEKKLANIFTGEDGEGRNSMESDHSRSSASEKNRNLASSSMDQQSSSYSRLEQNSSYGKSSADNDDNSSLYSRKSGREETDDFQSKYTRRNELDEQKDVLNKYSRKEKDEFDELDDEINAWRKNFREQQARKQRAYMEEAEEDDAALVPYQAGGRGRLVRQGYMDAEEDDDAFALVPRRPPPPEYIPDEEFEPTRRAETGEIVTERTQEIRTVVDKQGAVLEKLRRASSSFDELTSEIKNLKAQVIENSARRSFLMDDEFDDEEDSAFGAPPPARAGRLGNRYASGSKSFDFSSYTPGSYSSFRANRLADVDREYTDNITSGDSLGLARYKKPSYTTDDDDFSFSSSKTSSSYTSSYNKNRFASRGLGRVGRSKSLYDDTADHSDGDEFEEYKPRSRPLPSHDDDQPSYMASVGPGYGSGHGSGDPDLGRSSYRSRFSSADDSQTSSNRLSYTSRFSSSNSTSDSQNGGGYRSRLSRANTLSDFDFDRPSSKYSSTSSNSGFTSRFLQKVREKKTDGGAVEAPSEDAPKKSSKPFKSRFLRASFDSSDFTSKSSSYVSRFKGTSDSSSSIGASKSSDTVADTSAPSTDTAASDKTEE